MPQTGGMEPRVGIAHIEVTAADGTFLIGRDAFPDFERYARLGVHIQSDRVRIAAPPGLDIAPQPDAFCPVVGRVSMDYLTVDLSGAPWAQPGDEVVLLDDDPTSPCSVYALAQQCQTIPYEIFCNIGERIIRVGVNPSDAEMSAS